MTEYDNVILGSDAKAGERIVLCGDGLWRPVTESGEVHTPMLLGISHSLAEIEFLAEKILLAVTVLTEDSKQRAYNYTASTAIERMALEKVPLIVPVEAPVEGPLSNVRPLRTSPGIRTAAKKPRRK